ncbi:hypothetical protein HQ533_05980 [Candidatus Woesearchaeota archaeon]|nr:hypothetical protein [Candidatus Woesearchaeota archaeon]
MNNKILIGILVALISCSFVFAQLLDIEPYQPYTNFFLGDTILGPVDNSGDGVPDNYVEIIPSKDLVSEQSLELRQVEWNPKILTTTEMEAEAKEKAAADKKRRDDFFLKEAYGGDILDTIGYGVALGRSIAFVGSIFDWTASDSYTKSFDKFFSEGLGRVFDATNWENNLCLLTGYTDKSRTIMVSDAGSSQVRNGAYLKAYKTTSFEDQDGTTWKYYFVDWYLTSQKKSGLEVDVRLYEPNGGSRSILENEETKVLQIGEFMALGTQTYNFTDDYDKVCLVFKNDDLYNYFDFHSLDNGKLCQRINLIE